jgi:transcriptional regulator with XRE-family HTH domain
VDIADRIKSRRLELGMTLEDVANVLGVAKSTILRYETKDIGNMGIDKLETIAKALKCSPAYLMGWEVEKTAKGRELKFNDESFYVELTNPDADVSEMEMIGHIQDAFNMAAEQIKDPKILAELKKSILYQNEKISKKRSDAYAELKELVLKLDDTKLEQLCSYARYLTAQTK